MDIFERIKKDHDTLRSLLERAGKGEPDGAYDELQRELWAHGKAEETIFYAALEKSRSAREETVEGLNEHHMINGLLDELNAMTTRDMAFRAKLQVLGELVRHHLDEEEEELFEEAREAIDAERARELARLFDDRKSHALAALKPLSQG
ncbi:hemerythrin domain-containing protein [Azospirillum halopraeferens]|uniref:hemerythrin domain-containing protein n=1 Tax=Azospirillum halopraeferens TaxID=34010 RepID=UPI000420CBA0|nr:hemerythrin domain-containing protein [Azospirillum halopraeferens]